MARWEEDLSQQEKEEKQTHRTHDERHRHHDEGGQLKQKILTSNLPSYHDMTHRGHDEAKLHAIVATMDTMERRKSPEPS